MATVTADNLYHIDISDDPSFSSFISVLPEFLEFDDRIKGVGNCSWQISFSAVDEDGNKIVDPSCALWVANRSFLGPYWHWYRLRYGDVCIQSGVIVSTNTSNDTGFMSLAGKTWEHYLERWQYPFDPRVTPEDPVDHTQDYQWPNAFNGNEGAPGTGQALAGTGLAYEAYQRDVIFVLSDIFSSMMNDVLYRMTFDISGTVNPAGILTNYQLSLGDQTTMASIIDSLSQVGPGFDWWISWDKKLYWASPYRFGDPGYPTIAYWINNTTPLQPGALQFSNFGPKATHIFGRGAGLAVQTTLGRAYGYGPAQQDYTRLDETVDFGDVRNLTQLADMTHNQFAIDLEAQHEIPLTLDPSQIADFWPTFRKGRAIYIYYDLVSHQIDSLQQIVSFSAKDENNSGQPLVDFTLEQRYDLAWSAGTPEG